MKNIFYLHCVFMNLFSFALYAQTSSFNIRWDSAIMVSKTTPTLQVVVNPMLRSNSPIHKSSFGALKELGADYVRYVPWFPYPRLVVAELQPPSNGKTYWDFTLADSMMHDFMEATDRHSVVINFSTVPVWMYKTDRTIAYPQDPNEVSWTYNEGNELRDTTMKELTDYYVRLFSWYTKGGFTDELGNFHQSGHHYKIPYWEVFNEPDLEHNLSPQQYTKMYDAIVGGLKKISPETKFVGISLAFINNPEYFEYFLNPHNHKPGIPLDAISYHHYSTPWSGQTLNEYQYSFFDKAIAFLDKVRYIESIRKRLSPHTMTTINEIGSIIGFSVSGPIPDEYWNLSGALYAYIFLELTKMGIDVAGESQLVGYPTQFPDVSMMNWENGNPNARYWVLKLLKDNFGPGDQLVYTNLKNDTTNVVTQAFVTKEGRKLLLINTRNKEIQIALNDEVKNKSMSFVDLSTGEHEPAKMQLNDSTVVLKPFAVAVVKM